MSRSSSADARPVVATTLRSLVERAEGLASQGRRSVLGIVGAPGAGKSTVCDAVGAALGERAAVVGMDGFHLDDGVLTTLGRRHRKGAPDTFDVPGYVSLLRRLQEQREEVVYAPRFDRALEASRGSAVPVPRSVPLVITEGNYLLHEDDGWQEVRPLLDEVWFLDVPDDERVRRLVQRRLLFGDTPDDARTWVQQVDQPNATVVLAGRGRADLLLQLGTVAA